MIYKQLNSSEKIAVFQKILDKYGGIVEEEKIDKELYLRTIGPILKQFSPEELDLSNEHLLAYFKKEGWVNFVILYNPEVNAIALQHKGNELIGINLGLINYVRELLFLLFSYSDFLPEIGYSSLEVFEMEKVIPLLYPSDKIKGLVMPKCAIRAEAADRITLMVLRFIYAHEHGHLKHGHQYYAAQHFKTQEYLEFSTGKQSNEKVNLTKRCFEIQADRSAMIDTWRFWNFTWEHEGNKEVFEEIGHFEMFIYICLLSLRVLDPASQTNTIDSTTHPSYDVRNMNLFQMSAEYYLKNINSSQEAFLNTYFPCRAQIEEYFKKIGYESPLTGLGFEDDTVEKECEMYFDLISNKYKKDILDLITYRETLIQEEIDSFFSRKKT